MAEPIVSTYQHSQPGPSRKVIYSRIERSVSPKSERYRIKQLLLQEKFDAIEAQTDALRKRVQIVKKEVQRAMEVRKALCNLLDEKGDHWYKGCIEMDMSDKYDIDPLHDFAHLLRREEPGGRKRSRPSAKSKPKAVKAKEQPMTTEQKQEEERAKAKIVSIIDSVFSETAKKTAKSEQLINNKYSMKNAASRNTQTSAQVARHTSGSRSNKSSGGVTKASQSRIKNNVLHAKKALPYKIFSNKNQRKTIPADTVNGIHEGIKFTFIPRPNGVSKKKAEKKMATSHPTIQVKTPLVHDTPPVEPKTADIVDKRTENTAESKEMVPETDNSVKPVETEAADHAKNSEVASDSKESSILPLELANTAVEAPPTISAATVESS